MISKIIIMLSLKQMINYEEFQKVGDQAGAKCRLVVTQSGKFEVMIQD